MKQKVISKGYTFTVTSWEKDADNYKTNIVNVGESLQALEATYRLLNLCRSRNDGGIGNIYGSSGIIECEKIINFIKDPKNTLIFGDISVENLIGMEGVEYDEEEYENMLFEVFLDTAKVFLGGSENFILRVAHSWSVTYSPEDVYCDLVEDFCHPKPM